MDKTLLLLDLLEIGKRKYTLLRQLLPSRKFASFSGSGGVDV